MWWNYLWTKGQRYHVSQSEFSETLVHPKELDNKWDPAMQTTSWKDVHVRSTAPDSFVTHSCPNSKFLLWGLITAALLSPSLLPASSHTHRHQPAVPTRKGFLRDPSTPSAYCSLHSCSVLLPTREPHSAFLCPSLAGTLWLQVSSLWLPFQDGSSCIHLFL